MGISPTLLSPISNLKYPVKCLGEENPMFQIFCPPGTLNRLGPCCWSSLSLASGLALLCLRLHFLSTYYPHSTPCRGPDLFASSALVSLLQEDFPPCLFPNEEFLLSCSTFIPAQPQLVCVVGSLAPQETVCVYFHHVAEPVCSSGVGTRRAWRFVLSLNTANALNVC